MPTAATKPQHRRRPFLLHPRSSSDATHLLHRSRPSGHATTFVCPAYAAPLAGLGPHPRSPLRSQPLPAPFWAPPVLRPRVLSTTPCCLASSESAMSDSSRAQSHLSQTANIPSASPSPKPITLYWFPRGSQTS